MTSGSPADKNSYNTVVDFLGRVKKRLMQRVVVAAVIRSSTVLAVAMVTWVGLEALFFFNPLWRSLTAMTIGGSVLAVFIADMVRQLRGKRSLHDIALFAEHRCPDFRQRLITTLELLVPNRADGLHSRELMSATATSAALQAAGTEPREVVDDGRLRAGLRQLALTMSACLVLCVLLSDEMIPAFERCLHPSVMYRRLPDTSVTLLSGDLEIVKGDDAVIHFRVSGEVPPSVRVLHRASLKAPWEFEEILLDEPGTNGAAEVDSLRHVFAGVRRPLSYMIEAGDGASATAHISVLEPPVVQRLLVRYDFPPYTGLASRIDDVSGDVRGIIGTRVELEIVSSKPLRSAAVVIDDSLRLPTRTTDQRAGLAWYIGAPGSAQAQAMEAAPLVSGSQYHVELTDLQGIGNRDPIRYDIRPLFDEAPRIAVTEPGRDADLPEDLQVLLGIEAQDDFGLGEVELVYRVNDGDESRIILSKGGSRELAVVYAWDLNGVDLLPEDLIHYFFEVSDNDQVSGAKKGRSRDFAFRYPSLYELMTELSQTQSDEIEALEELAAGDEDTAEFIEEIRRDLLKKEELTWQQHKELEATIEQQQQRAAAVSEVAQQMEKTMQAMQENGLASSEVLDKLEQIRELMQAVTSPQLQQALRSLQEAMDSAEPQEMAKALADFAADHEAFQQQLDRTLALLRQVAVEQRLEAAVEQAKDLLSRQQRIDEEMKKPPEQANTNLQRQEAGLSEDAQTLQQQLSKLAEDARPYGEETANALEDEAQSMLENRLSGRMKELAAQLRSPQQQAEAKQLGENLEEELGILAAGLEQIQQEFTAAQKQDLLRALKEATESLVELSVGQEDLCDRTKQQKRSAAALAQLADEQFALLNGTGLLIDQLAEIGQKTVNLNLGLSTTLGHGLKNMQEAIASLSDGNAARSTPRQQDALENMNEAAMLLRESADSIRKSRSPSGFGEAMEKMMGMSEQQAALNQATQESLGQGTQLGREGRAGQDWRAQMSRLAREQRQIQQALAELERGLRGHQGTQRQLAEIDKEMDAALKEMKRSNPSPRLAQSQQRILQRMLDASRSINTRGFKQERMAESGAEFSALAGVRLPTDLGQAPDELREAMKRALAGDYPHEYWEGIRRYYELVYKDVAQESMPAAKGSSSR